jgi:3-phosphoshikimate 1-carboxyvinyltransferase
LISWQAPVAAGPIIGRLVVPGSKSASARSLLLAALADRPAQLTGVLDSRDTSLMCAGLSTLGASFDDHGGGLIGVSPISAVRGGGQVDVGLAGTVLRFLPPVAVLAEAPTRFSGDAAASKRPVAPLLSALASLGATVSQPFAVPFDIAGGPRFTGGSVTIDASASSQFISALLLAGARYPDGIIVRHVGASLPSRPHIEMTCTMLRRRGVLVNQPDESTWQVSPTAISGTDDVVEPDLTNAATLLAAAVITGGALTTAWPADSVQASAALAAVLEAFGASLTYTETAQGRELTVSGSGVQGAEVDLQAVSELTPVAAALAAVATSPSLIRGVGHIRGHETDRLSALATELSALGVTAVETADGLRITPRRRHGGVFHTYADHRMAHAGALLGLVTPGVVLDDVACTTKTLPDFPGLWAGLVEGTS